MRPTLFRGPALALLLGAGVAQAQQAPAGVQGEILAWYDDAANKIVQLAEAIPAEKYSWRPSEGVRTVAEVVGHVAGGNYFLMGMTGAQPPANAPRNLEQMTAKADLIRALQQSIEFTRTAMRAMTAADLDAPATIFGRNSTKRDACLLAMVHAHEHLGQLIAYARSNGVTPPWSMGGGQ
jgi:uncharacterized damage-inducible protein DinB